jgi:hypothetical protein
MPNHIRPERQRRLNPPIYALIKKPRNRNRNNEAYIPNALTYESKEEPYASHSDNDGINNALSYDNTMVPYRNYTSYVDNNDGVRNALTYEGAATSYRDYSAYNDITCSLCDEVFQSKRALNNHQNSCKPSVYPCNVCGKNLSSKHSLTQHIRAMHQTRSDIRSVEQKFT